MTNFELLPNEIFLDLFEYLDSTDLLHAFYGLNSRFNWLLYKQYRAFRFNFKSISKRQFDMICEQHLPFIADRVITLALSNATDTPKQIDLFICYISSINSFIHLRSLSLCYLHTHETIMKILDQCHDLCHFTHIKIDSSYFGVDLMVYQSIIDSIWSLPKLIHCELNSSVSFGSKACTPTNISSSLERLSLSYTITLNGINRLCQYTPRLKYLSVDVEDFDSDYLPSILPTLISLIIRVIHLFDTPKLICLLQNMPNLRVLNIDLSFKIIDGDQWEELIGNYLPELKRFGCEMGGFLNLNENIQKQVHEFIDPFRSTFWIDEHRWFVRCVALEKTISLYTSLKTLSYHEKTFPRFFLSTHPEDNRQRFCNDLTKIYSKEFFHHLIPSNICLTNLEHLQMKFPIPEQFWSIVPNLNRLHALTVYLNINTSQSEFQTLLDLAPHLYKLDIHEEGSVSWPPLPPLQPSQMALLRYTNKSVRHLDLNQFALFSNEEECLALTESSLGGQCEVLYVQVNSREHILNLVENMKNLRALNVYCKNNLCYNGLLPTDTGQTFYNEEFHDDEIIEWLKERLPLTYSLGKEIQCYTNQIQIWIQ